MKMTPDQARLILSNFLVADADCRCGNSTITEEIASAIRVLIDDTEKR